MEHSPDRLIDAMPGLAEAIRADRTGGVFERWGESTVIDENTEQPVLPAELVIALHERAGLASDGLRGNAGLLHVYGYLLSTVVTPFGAKGERWTGGGVARALGLPVDALLPPSSPTPLAALTPVLESLLAHPDAGLARVDERSATVSARTVIVTNQGHAALVYGVGDDLDALRPVTVFPIDDAIGMLKRLAAEPPRLRYNAVDRRGSARVAMEHRTATGPLSARVGRPT